MAVQVEIYTCLLCPYCWQARALLRAHGIRYRQIRIWRLLGVKLPTLAFREMVRRSGGRRDVPQIFVGGAYLGDEETLAALARRGELTTAIGSS